MQSYKRLTLSWFLIRESGLGSCAIVPTGSRVFDHNAKACTDCTETALYVLVIADHFC